MGSMSVSKYMIEASYTVDGVKGVLKEGGSGRRARAVYARRHPPCFDEIAHGFFS